MPLILVIAANTEKITQFNTELCNYITETQTNTKSEIHILDGTFLEIKSKLLSLVDCKKIFILNGAFYKSERYEFYCISRRFNTSFLIVHIPDKTINYEVTQFTSSFDGPVIDIEHDSQYLDTIVKYMNKNLKSTRAHTSNMTRNNQTLNVSKEESRDPSCNDYLKNVQLAINEIRSTYSDQSFVYKEVLDACETVTIRLVSLNPKTIEDVKYFYSKMVVNELKLKGLQ
ncbi:hypothetical protein CWI39_0460p0010 [Hamiltosporidium magnivora]|uniref:Uncharacterized protein n=1 Tax=Hamiltosporidium magnivora TaxID=148818 RepID=A0A4Q9LF86_9MICR|nr:hypothetical protein CWI36_0625p0030 [Hamiltosporidium magnivora]TBU06594.1 hypothetical protein CWI39_0460p0010 [Hamiltosporidium magnivora]